ncbi:hypothetical protein JCGZ_10709 [Jatropha curcas]|uniref:Cytochrome P450 n=1 Tax=Jatropha curcas TaxID=180498 RepID=A0A067KSC4_JATCU|nr:hypothetical protein JCGZ_10709 [Jatropha curcas]
MMRSQGIKGPSYKLFYGNNKEIIHMTNKASNNPMELSHQVFPTVLPHVHSWMKLYGPQAYWVFSEPDELIKEIFNNRDGAFPKPEPDDYTKKLIGEGIGTTRIPEKWLKLRRLSNHAFHAECLKSMIPAMITSVEMMLEKWRHNGGKEIEVFQEFKVLASEIISRTAFGSSYLEGQRIFDMINQLTLIIGIHTDWQDKARKEVLELFGQQNPSSDTLSKMKIVSMIINEALRLYPPVLNIPKAVQRQVRLGKLVLPANIIIEIPVIALHHDPEIWGEDVCLFKPDRFAEGLAKATNNNVNAYLPFSLGSRSCVGYNFAI